MWFEKEKETGIDLYLKNFNSRYLIFYSRITVTCDEDDRNASLVNRSLQFYTQYGILAYNIKP